MKQIIIASYAVFWHHFCIVLLLITDQLSTIHLQIKVGKTFGTILMGRISL